MGELLTLDRVQAGLERAGATVELLEGFLRVGIAIPTASGLWGLVVLVESTSEGDLLAVAPGVATVPGLDGEEPASTEARALRLVNRWNASKLWPKLYVDDQAQEGGGRMLVGECWAPFPNGADDALLDQTLSIVMSELRSAVEALAAEPETRPVALIEEHLAPELQAAVPVGTEGSERPEAAVPVVDGAVGAAPEGGQAAGSTSPEPAAATVGVTAGVPEGLAGWLGLASSSGEGSSAAFPGEPVGTWSLSDLVLGGPPRDIEVTGLQHGGNGTAFPGVPASQEDASSGPAGPADGVVASTAPEAPPPPITRPVPAPTTAPAPVVPTPAPGGASSGIAPTALPPTVPSVVSPLTAPPPTAPPPTAPPPTAPPPTAPPGRPLLWGQVASPAPPPTAAQTGAGPDDEDDPEALEAERAFKEAMGLRAEIVEVLEAGDLARARPMLERAVPVFQEVGLEPQAMLFEVTLGEVCRDLGDLEAALAAMRRGWAWFHERKEIFEADLARVEQSLATTLVRAGQLDEARTFFESARASYTRRSLPEAAAECDRELGAIALRTGGFDEARQRFQAAQSRFERLGLAPESAGARLALGMACALQGDFAEAERAYGAARETFVALADEANVAECDFGLGVVAIRTGRPADAAAHYARARATLESLGRAVEVANCDRELAVAALAVGDLGAARQRYSAARAAFASLGRDRDVAVCDEGLRAIAVRSGAPT